MRPATPALAQPTSLIPESSDFATRSLGDPWDMSEFTDVSAWLNHAGADNYTVNMQVNDGVFSATAQGDYSEFFALFPGYQPGTLNGKIGALHPIDSSVYSCIYLNMYADWGSEPYNYFIVFWGPDRDIGKWMNPSNVWGQAGGVYTKGQWQLYRIDLNNPAVPYNKPWSYQQYWQALRITPSLVAGTQFAVDWVRLTDCQPVYTTLSGLPQGTFSLWLGTGSPLRQVLVLDSFSPDMAGSYDWDVQGLAAGTYNYYVEPLGGGTPVQQGQLTIVGTPIARFTRPSPLSGPDYATSNSNAWDFDSSDVTDMSCTSPSWDDGILALATLPPGELNPPCVGSGENEADPRILLNTPDHGNLSAYRYLSFSSSLDAAWSIPDHGMIVRLFWQLGRPGEDCYYTSRAIAQDTGWHTYSVDLYNLWNGTPEEFTPSNCGFVSWSSQASIGPLVQFRLDPNENITGDTLHQQFDWLRLTQVDRVAQGAAFPVKVLLNKPLAELQDLSFFYTTDLLNPFQNAAILYTPPPLNGPFRQFLPVVRTPGIGPDPFVTSLPADFTFNWDTRSVAPGEYYLCVQLNDGYNQAVYCSEAPVQVYIP